LTLRAVPRSTIILGWFAAGALPVVVGIGAAALLSWIAVANLPAIGDLAERPLVFVALAAAAATAGLQAVGIGLAAGSLARPWLAALLAILVMGGLAALASALGEWDAYLPTGGLWVLAHADVLAKPLADGVMSVGFGLAASGLLVVIAAALFSRVDL
jgi:hypothetical protein